MRIAIINGPNLNLVGRREPGIYGNTSFETYLKELRTRFEVDIDYFQSNSEGEIVDQVQKSGFDVDGIVLNAGAYTHTSLAIADAIRAIDAPVIEVHISNTAARESYRQHSYIASVCLGTITGFGLDSYELAIRAFLVHGK